MWRSRISTGSLASRSRPCWKSTPGVRRLQTGSGRTASSWTLTPGQAIIDAAEEMRKRLEAAELEAFVKTSGGKGLHVCAPLKPSGRWPAVKTVCKAIADAMAKDSADKHVSTITKSKPRGKILIDYLRDQCGMTAVALYSTRARPGGAVSMPLGWSELSADIGPAGDVTLFPQRPDTAFICELRLTAFHCAIARIR